MSSQAASQAIYAVSAIIDPLTEHSLEKKVLVISTRGSDRSICLQRNGIAGGERMAGTAIGSRPESSTIAPNSTLVSLYGSANVSEAERRVFEALVPKYVDRCTSTAL